MAVGRGTERFRWVLGMLGVSAVLLVAYTGYQALQVRAALETVASEFEQTTTHVTNGDEAGARRSLDAAQAAAQEALRNTEGPGWWLTTRLPGVQDDVEAIRTVADVTETLTTLVLPDMVRAGETLDPSRLRPSDGTVQIEPIRAVAPTVIIADSEMQLQERRVAALTPDTYNPQLAEPVSLLQERFAEAAALSKRASRAVRLLPAMLGAEEERRYLVLLLDNADMRAVGGAVGSYAILTAQDGRLSLGEPASAAALGSFDRPVLPLTRGERAVYGDRLGRSLTDVTRTPDFPRSAELAAAMWRASGREPVHGVVAVDPVALSYLLEATGPVEVPADSGADDFDLPAELTADNLVDVLLDGVPQEWSDPQRQQRYRAAAVAGVYGALTSDAGAAEAVLDGVARGASERRLLVWVADEQEQALIAGTRTSGRLPTDQRERPFVGVFLNGGPGERRQDHLAHQVDVEPVSCERGRRQRLRVTVTLTSSAPEPTRVAVSVYTPAGGYFEEATLDGRQLPLGQAPHAEHRVGFHPVTVGPGDRRELSYTVFSGTHQPGDVRLRVTPGVHSTGVGTVSDPAC